MDRRHLLKHSLVQGGRKTIFAAGIAALSLSAGLAAAQTRISIWDGVYSDLQAERGRTHYMQNCSRCHGADLSGNFETPPLVGRFMPYWSGTSLDALFDYVSTAMPLDHPGALGAGANTDILAYILKSNALPSGSRELSADRLKSINFDPAKPVLRRARR
jgi:cytochrome c